jgi:O-antigen/teichoic acid export membrane protein
MHVIKDMVRFSIGNYVASILDSAPVYVLPLIIIAYLGAPSGAYFSISFSISSVFGMVVGSTCYSLLAEGIHDPVKLRRDILKAARLMVFFLVPGTIIIFLVGKQLLGIFGHEYSENSLKLLWFFSLSWIPNIITMIYITIIRIKRDIGPLICVEASFSVIIIGMSCLLIPHMGLVGVGVAFLSAQVGIAIITGILLLRLEGFSFRRFISKNAK